VDIPGLLLASGFRPPLAANANPWARLWRFLRMIPDFRGFTLRLLAFRLIRSASEFTLNAMRTNVQLIQETNGRVLESWRDLATEVLQRAEAMRKEVYRVTEMATWRD
jgi:hypothetical protein